MTVDPEHAYPANTTTKPPKDHLPVSHPMPQSTPWKPKDRKYQTGYN